MKTTLTKLISLFLCLTFLLSLAVPSYAANESNDEGVTFSVVLDKAVLQSNSSAQTVTMTLTASRPITYDGIGFTVSFNAPITFTAVSGTGMDFAEAGINYATGVAGGSSATAENVTGTALATVTFTVPANVPAGSYALGVTGIELTRDYGTKLVESGASATTALSVINTSAVWGGEAATAFASGSGTETDPYLIMNAPQLAFFAASVNGGESYAGKFVKLGADIALNSTTAENWTATARTWTPIGTEQAPFKGTFDGSGCAVSGLYIYAIDTTTTWKPNQGLFGYTNGATLKNLQIIASSVTGGNYVGAVVGYGYNTSLDNCDNHGSVTGDNYVAGVAGYAGGRKINWENIIYFDVKNCDNTGTVEGDFCSAGVVARGTYANFNNCTSSGKVHTAGYGAAGIACEGNDFESCLNSGNITGYARDSMSDLGGVGGIAGNGNAFINCTNTGTIDAYVIGGNAGGIAGWGSTFTNCDNCGQIPSGSGIAGFGSTFTNCTNSGSVARAGIATKGFTFTNCTNSGSVGFAGIAGYGDSFTNCINTGAAKGCGIVNSLGSDRGGSAAVIKFCINTGEVGSSGIVGSTSTGSLIEFCYNTGSNPVPESIILTDSTPNGGIVGTLYKSTVRNCYNTGTFCDGVVGGIVGRSSGGDNKDESYIINCYNLGRVIGLPYRTNSTTYPPVVGGIVGDAITTGITNCYYLENCAVGAAGALCAGVGMVNGSAASADVAGQTKALTLEQMKAQPNFAGFDFASVWTMAGNASYPYPELLTPVLTDAPTVELPRLLSAIVQPAAITGIAYGTPWANSWNKTDGIVSKLPQTVTLNLTDGSTAEAAVTWTCANYAQQPADKLSHTYTAAGTVTLPAGIGNPSDIALTTSVDFIVSAFALSVAHVQNPYNLSVLSGTPFADFGLPKTLQVRMNDNTFHDLPVTWTAPTAAEYNPALTTEQTVVIKGKVTLPDGCTDPYGYAANVSVTVTVGAKQTFTLQQVTLNRPTFPNGHTLPNGTPIADFDLPDMAILQYYSATSGYATTTLPIVWDIAASGYDPAKQEEQVLTIKGKVNLPGSILDPNGLAQNLTYTLTVSGRAVLAYVSSTTAFNIPNGTPLSEMELPDSVPAYLKSDKIEYVPVTWDLSSVTGYDPTYKGARSFTVLGTATLPTHIDNPDNRPLATSVTVYVAAAATLYLSSVATNVGAVNNVPNGTALENISLPSTTTISLSSGVTMRVNVKWDLTNIAYDRTNKLPQSFTVNGKVELPGNIPNPNNLSLDALVTVNVLGADGSSVTPNVPTTPSGNNPYLQKVHDIADLTVVHGTAVTAWGLPSKVKIDVMTPVTVGLGLPSWSSLTREATVVWNTAGIVFDPANPHLQRVVVPGTVLLPQGVGNTENVSTAVSVIVWVNGDPDSGCTCTPGIGAGTAGLDAAALGILAAAAQNNRQVNISTAAGIGGTVSPVGVMAVQYDTDVVIQILPDPGYVIAAVLVDGRDVGPLSSYTFKNVKAAHSLTARFAPVETEAAPEPEWENPFLDVTVKDPNYAAIRFVAQNGYMKGISRTQFAPEKTMTLGQLLTVLGRYAEVDVSYYTADDPYAAWAAESRLISTPDAAALAGTVSVGDAAALIVRYAAAAGCTLSPAELYGSADPVVPVTRALIAAMISLLDGGLTA